MRQSNIMLRIQADLLQIAVKRPNMVETTALGAAIAAGLKAKFWENMDHVKHCIGSGSSYQDFEPTITPEKARKLKEGWKDAISRCFRNKEDVIIIKPTESESMVNGHVLVGLMMGVLAFSLFWGRRK